MTERDNGQRHRAVEEGLRDRRPGPPPNLAKREIVDLIDVKDKDGSSLFGARPGDFGLGNPFKLPYSTVEAVLPLTTNELAFVNDTNFGSTGRNANLPDYSGFIVLQVPGIRG